MLDAPPRPAAVRASLLAAGVGGAAVALQARVNGELRVAVDDALLAACVSFAGGLLVLVAVVALRPAARAALPRLRAVPLWQRLGGLGGAVLIAVSAAAAPRLGVALLTLALVAGQTVGGLAVDRSGLSPGGGARALTPARVGGAVLCLSAVALAAPGSTGDLDPLLLVLVLGAGLLVSAGAALNGRVRTTTGDASVTTLLNFLVGLAALLVGFALHAAVAGAPSPDWPGPERGWLYLGGLLGACFVAVASVVVRTVGVLRMSLAVIAGQVLGALLLDLLAPLGDTEVGLRTLLGAALTLVAVGVSGLGSRS